MLKIFLILFILSFILQAQPVQKFAGLGDFKLESGEVIKDCVIGYRTCGEFNDDSTNVIILLTYFGGTSNDLLSFTGSGMMADSAAYFVVVIDAFGNGVSSSPSNSTLQSNESFPLFNIRDMVKAQYLLVTKFLGINHVLSVMGTSMGGMQSFQWIASYPDFMDKAVILVGSPKLTSNDLLLWNSQVLAIEEGHNCNAPEEAIKNTVVAIHVLNLWTPEYIVEHITPEELPKYLKDEQNNYTKMFNSYDWKSQLCGMIAHNVFAPFGNDMEKTASVVKAKAFIITSKQDHMVNPKPASDFAKLINAETLELDNNWGHFGAGYDMENLYKKVSEFLRDR